MNGSLEISFLDAIRVALREEMARDPLVCLLGEDIGERLGGVYGATAGLQAQFGTWRVLDTPMAPSALAGAAVGMALMGMRPVLELQSFDFLPLALDQIVTSAAKLHWRTGGTMQAPLVIRGPAGGGTHGGPWRSASPEAWLAQIPGLKVVMPATPYDAKGLLKAAIRDNNPVLFLEPRYLYRRLSEALPTEEYTVPIGQAEIRRPGTDLTLITYGAMLYPALEAAETLYQGDRVSAEVIDLRSLAPLDMATIAASVHRTGRALIAHEAPRTGGIGAEIAAQLAEDYFAWLDTPIARVAAPDAPYPAARELEVAYIPGAEAIVAAVRKMIAP